MRKFKQLKELSHPNFYVPAGTIWEPIPGYPSNYTPVRADETAIRHPTFHLRLLEGETHFWEEIKTPQYFVSGSGELLNGDAYRLHAMRGYPAWNSEEEAKQFASGCKALATALRQLFDGKIDEVTVEVASSNELHPYSNEWKAANGEEAR